MALFSSLSAGKAFFVWLMFVRVGLFLMGSENRNRALLPALAMKCKRNIDTGEHGCKNLLVFMIATFSLTEILTFC